MATRNDIGRLDAIDPLHYGGYGGWWPTKQDDGYITGHTGYIWNIGQCPFCQGYHTNACPSVKSVEYYENGQIKRIEYKD